MKKRTMSILATALALAASHGTAFSEVFNPPPPPSTPIFVAPPAGLPPVLLPSFGGILPPDLTPASTGEPLPPPLALQAEQIAATAAISFAVTHPGFSVQITDQVDGNGAFSLTLTELDGHGNSLVYQIMESKARVDVSMVLIDGAYAEYLTAAQEINPASPGKLVDAKYYQGQLTSLVVENSVNGNTTTSGM